MGELDGELKYFDIDVNFGVVIVGLYDVVSGVDCGRKLFDWLIVDLIVCIGSEIGWVGVIGWVGFIGL